MKIINAEMKWMILLMLFCSLSISVCGMNNITLYYNATTGQYATPGFYESSVIDAGAGDVYYCEIDWVYDKPTGTDVKLALRSGNTNPPTGSYRGYDGGVGSYYLTHPSRINNVHNGDRFMQWQSELSTSDTSVTPTLIDVSISYTTDGDLSPADCECAAGAYAPYSGTCTDGATACWHAATGKCCGDDNSMEDYFYLAGHGGCVFRPAAVRADLTPPVINSISASLQNHYYFNVTANTVHFNNAIAAGKSIVFSVDWEDANTDLGLDHLSLTRGGGLIGTVTGNSGPQSPADVSYAFAGGDSNGTLLLSVRDAVHYQDSRIFTFVHDDIAPSCNITINGGAGYTESPDVMLDIDVSDDRGVRDCAFVGEDGSISSFQPCSSNMPWRLMAVDGTRYATLIVRDLAGNNATCVDEIVLDRSRPNVIINDGREFTNLTDVNVSVTMEFPGDPVLCSMRNDGLAWGEWNPCPAIPDAYSPKFIWTLQDIVGIRQFSINVSTTFGVYKVGNDTIHYDPHPPTGSLRIRSLEIPGFHESNENYTAYSTVTLEMTSDDGDSGVDRCRFANDGNEEANFSSWETCKEFKTWILNDIEGERVVFMQIRDRAGNVFEINDSIIFDRSGAGLDMTPPEIGAIIVDEGEWKNSTGPLYAYWFGAYDPESMILNIPLVYNVTLNSSSNDTICDWIFVGSDNEIIIDDSICPGLDIIHGETYFFKVRTINSAGLFIETTSDGITIDIGKPTMGNIISSHEEGLWGVNSTQKNVVFRWPDAHDDLSGIYGFSYVLDTRSDTIPDNIPEGQMGDFASEVSVNYSNVIDGVLYFHIKARDVAGNWGDTEHYEIRVDGSPPTVPQMEYRNKTTNATHMNFEWTESFDIHSGLSHYIFELYNSSDVGYSDFLVNRTDVYTNYLMVYDLTPNITYFARVRAVNNVGLESIWSSQVSTRIDTDGPEINIIIPGNIGVCPVASTDPILRITTDETAVCTYHESIDNIIEMGYSGSVYHESRMLFPDGNHTITVRCVDDVGNPSELNRTFIVDQSHPRTLVSILPENPYYTHNKASVLIEYAGKLGGIKENMINFSLDGNPVSRDDFSITDIGCGKYKLEFNGPSKAGSYAIRVSHGDSIIDFIDFIDFEITVSYQSSSLGTAKELGKMVYIDSGEAAVGAATEGGYMNASSVVGGMRMSANPFENSIYLFGVSSGRTASSRDKLLESKEFSQFPAPNFGEDRIGREYLTMLYLDIPNTRLDGVDEISSGRYSLVVRKVAEQDGKSVLNVTISG